MNVLRALPLAACFLVSACVPTEPEKEFRGGISVKFSPSEATAGAPFQTPDGWTVTIEKTALRAVATSLDGSGAQPRVIDPRYECELRVTGLPPGLVPVYVALGKYAGVDSDDVDSCAVDEPTLRRFKELRPSKRQGEPPESPSVYVKGVATKDGRRLSFDWALVVGSYTALESGSYNELRRWEANIDRVRVATNEGTPVRFEVHFEKLFAKGLDELAEADANGDGSVTLEELGYRLRNLVTSAESILGNEPVPKY